MKQVDVVCIHLLFGEEGKNAEFSNQNLLRGNAGLRSPADADDGLHGTGAEQDFEKKEERKMSEATIIIIFAAFLFGVIMGLCLGKANK